jgi:conjugative relaxase-like TrwC/TraI family protein
LFTNSLIDEKMLNVARGSVNNDKFDAMLKGNFNGIELGRIENGKKIHHPGWDHTFSAPKSTLVKSS